MICNTTVMKNVFGHVTFQMLSDFKTTYQIHTNVQIVLNHSVCTGGKEENNVRYLCYSF